MTKDQTPPNVPEELLDRFTGLAKRNAQTLAEVTRSVTFAQTIYGPELSHEEILSILRSEHAEPPGWPDSIMVVFHPSFLEHLKNLRTDLFTLHDPTDAERITRARRLLKEIGDAMALTPREKKRGKPWPLAYQRAMATRKRNDSEGFAGLLEETSRLVERYEEEYGRTVSRRTSPSKAFDNFLDLLKGDLAEDFEKQATTFLKQVHGHFVPLPTRVWLDRVRCQVAQGITELFTERRRGPRRFKEIAQRWNPGGEKLLSKRSKPRSLRK